MGNTCWWKNSEEGAIGNIQENKGLQERLKIALERCKKDVK